METETTSVDRVDNLGLVKYMETKRELLERLRQISSEQLGVQQDEITGESTWAELGADSLDRLEMTRAIENEFKVEIPHTLGERLNTVGEAVDHLLSLIAVRKETSHIRIEAVTTNQQWVEALGVRTQVFTVEHGFSFKPLAGPGERGVWHFLARDNGNAVGTLSVVDVTDDHKLHRLYRLSFDRNDRVARYAQLAILKPYRKRGIFKMLTETAESTVIRPNGFAAGWLLYPADRAHSSVMGSLGFAIEAPVLATEFGKCHVFVRRESRLPQMNWSEEPFPIIDTCPI